MFGPVGGFEILVLLALGLLIFGPRRLPEIGRTLGRAMSEFRKAALELRTSIEREIDLEEVKKTTQEIRKEVREGLETLDPMKDPATAGAVREVKEAARSIQRDVGGAARPGPAAGSGAGAASGAATASDEEIAGRKRGGDQGSDGEG